MIKVTVDDLVRDSLRESVTDKTRVAKMFTEHTEWRGIVHYFIISIACLTSAIISGGMVIVVTPPSRPVKISANASE